MKLLREDYERDGGGSVVLECEVSDDIWALYNIITCGDQVKGTTSRKVHKESASGSVSTEVRKISLEVLVKKTDYEGDGDVLRVSGPVTEENPFVKVGAYHTLELTLRSKLTLYKENWDRIYVDAMRNAVDPHRKAELQVVLIESGLCQIFLVTSSLAKRVARIQASIPKQRGPYSNYEKAKKRFYNDVFGSLILHTNFEAIKCVLVAGPGFTKDEFLQFVHEEAARRDCRSFISNRKMFILASASTAHRHALVDLLADPSIAARLDNTKAYRNARKLQEFYHLCNADLRGDDTASGSLTCYGPREVGLAADAGAVKTLLITDGLLRSSCGAQRKIFLRIAEEVEKGGGEVLIFSDQHSSGEQLNMLSGIAAILLFPMGDEMFDDGEGNSRCGKERKDRSEGDGHGRLLFGATSNTSH